MSECFSKPRRLGGSVKVELDLSSYVAKSDLKMRQVLIHQNCLKKLILQA